MNTDEHFEIFSGFRRKKGGCSLGSYAGLIFPYVSGISFCFIIVHAITSNHYCGARKGTSFSPHPTEDSCHWTLKAESLGFCGFLTCGEA